MLNVVVHGENVVSESVSFQLIGEKVAADGTITSSDLTETLGLLPSFANTGEVVVIFPDELAVTADRFYIYVNCLKYSNIMGWSPGYFYLESAQHSLTNVRKMSIQSVLSSKHVESHIKPSSVADRVMHDRNVRLEATCSSSQISSSFTSESGGELGKPHSLTTHYVIVNDIEP